MHNRSFSDYLFPRPSLLSGIARLFDFLGLFDSYNSSPVSKAADAKALYADWRTVGSDLRHALGQQGHES